MTYTPTAKIQIDMRGVDLGRGYQSGMWNEPNPARIFAVTTRKAAEQFAKECGWKRADVRSAENKFFRFWVVCQPMLDSITFLCEDKTTRSIEIAEIAK